MSNTNIKTIYHDEKNPLQTNIGNNNNKYYIIQLLEDDEGTGYRYKRIDL